VGVLSLLMRLGEVFYVTLGKNKVLHYIVVVVDGWIIFFVLFCN
jgi:hypothetical protein